MAKTGRGDLTATPHDAIIKFTFSQREHATGLLQAALAPEIVAAVDWQSLKLEKIHFVDRSLRGRYADLLFSAQAGNERAYVYVLVEHQSRVERFMILRMGSYMLRNWEHLVRDEPTRERVPVIVPILIHHSPTGWTAATAFEDIVSAPESAHAALAPYIPRFSMKLVDVSHDPSGGLVKQALTDLGRVVLWCLSIAGDDARLAAEIDQLVAEINRLYAAPQGLDALLAVLRYLAATHQALGAKKIADIMETTARKGQKEIAMDVFDEAQLRGRLEGRTGTLLEQLAARFGAVPAKAKVKILAADEKTLSRWSLRVLTAPTLAAVLDDVPAGKKQAAPAKRPTTRRRASA